MSVNASGTSGELRCGYQVAARLGRWAFNGAGSVEAHPIEVNQFWLDQSSGLVLKLDVGRRQWVWRDVQVIDKGSPLRLRVGESPELR